MWIETKVWWEEGTQICWQNCWVCKAEQQGLTLLDKTWARAMLDHSKYWTLELTKRRSTNLYTLESELGTRIGFLNIITIFCSIGSAADQQGLMGGGAVKYADKTWARAGFDQKPTNYMRREGYGKTPNKGKTLLHSIFMEITKARLDCWIPVWTAQGSNG